VGASGRGQGANEPRLTTQGVDAECAVNAVCYVSSASWGHDTTCTAAPAYLGRGDVRAPDCSLEAAARQQQQGAAGLPLLERRGVPG
jgi:hypothetical protein